MPEEENQNNVSEEEADKVILGHHHRGADDQPRIDFDDLLNAPDMDDYVKADGSTAFTGTGDGFKDEDDMASDDATAVPSQQSVKKFVENSIRTIYAASNTLQRSEDDEVSGTDTAYTQVTGKEITVYNPGTIRVKFDLKATSSIVYGKIYVNDIAIGTERSDVTGSYVTFSEDITVVKDDVVQIYAWTSNDTNPYYVRNFRLYWDEDIKGYVDDQIDTIDYEEYIARMLLMETFISSDNWTTFTSADGTVTFEVGKCTLHVASSHSSKSGFWGNNTETIDNNKETTIITEFKIDDDTASAAGQADFYVVTLNDAGSGNVGIGFGFKVTRDTDGTRLYAINKEASTGNTSATEITGFDLTINHRYKAVYTPDTEVKFYVDGTLKVTHDTSANFPDHSDNKSIINCAIEGDGSWGDSWNVYIRKIIILGEFT